jgi:hypothetical protein
MNRRAQPAVTVRSTRAVDRLKLLTRDGRSQVEVIEEALERMPLPPADPDRILAARARIDAAVARLAASGHQIPSMAEFDAKEYDERGNLR